MLQRIFGKDRIMYQQLNDEGRALISELSQRHGFSQDAVEHMLRAVWSGGGRQAQFGHPEFGGMGQWSMGGMIMIGDMFNNSLKARVDSLCNDVSGALSNRTLFAPVPQQQVSSGQQQWQGGSSGVSYASSGMGMNSGWPSEFGQPASQGSQNNMRYAIFPQTRRLAISDNGRVTVYDTGDHNIGGIGQAQSGDQTLTFTSQYGLVSVGDLPVVSSGEGGNAQPAPEPTPQSNSTFQPDQSFWNQGVHEQQPEPPRQTSQPEAPRAPAEDDIFGRIEKLADLHTRGILSDDEFQSKKTELLSRL